MQVQVANEPEEVVFARRLAEEFERVTTGLGPHFRRREAHEAASNYVKALLSRAERKNDGVWPRRRARPRRTAFSISC